jgi:hypothetical protein
MSQHSQRILNRIEVLPEDIQAIIYRKLYSSILCDMKRTDIFKNTKYFHKLLEITDNPLIYDLDYLGMLNINNIYDIFTYKKNELFRPDTAIYQRSHFTKKLEISLDNIEISNEPLFNLYKSNKIYYWAFESEYFNINTNININKLQIQLRKGTFVLRQSVPFSCMAELLYNVIDFYNRIKDFLYANLSELRCIEDEGDVLSQRQRKNKYIMENALHYHINNRFIIRFDYDIDTKSAYPILLPY